jgi:hypothetical protein
MNRTKVGKREDGTNARKGRAGKEEPQERYKTNARGVELRAQNGNRRE